MDEKRYIGNLSNGVKVYDREDSHWKSAHTDLPQELLAEALSKVVLSDKKDQFVIAQAVDMGRVVGKKTCVPVTEEDKTFMAHRKGRVCDSHIVIDREPMDHDKIVVILRKNDDFYTLVTSYVGDLTPREPGDPSLLRTNNPELIREAEEFWSSHALVYNKNELDYVISPEGEKIDTDTFEETYMKKKSSNDEFDIPDGATIMLMGIAASGKSSIANKIKERYPAEILSSDEIRGEIFKNELANGEREKVFSDEGKDRVYNEIVSRIDKNMQEGKRTIADATFLFETGTTARKNIYKVAKKYNRPLRIIMLKTPLELAKKLNQKRSRHVNEDVIEEMWQYLEETRDTIKAELNEIPNAKYKEITTEELIGNKDIIPEINSNRNTTNNTYANYLRAENNDER